MMGLWSGFISCAAIAKIMPVKNTRFFEQTNSTVNGRNRNLRIDRRSAFVQQFDIRMIIAVRQDARDHAALFSDAQPLVGAKLFEIDLLRQFGLRS